MRHEELLETVSVPEGCTIKVEDKKFFVKGPKGELSRVLPDKKIIVETGDGEVSLKYKNATKREKRMLLTTKAHVKNLVKGVMDGFSYKLKICSGHFPMNVSLKNNVFEIKNFIGEKVPRTLVIKEGVDVKVNGDEILVESLDKELAGQVAGRIENLTKRPNFDKRIFQDGIYIIEKDGKKIS